MIKFFRKVRQKLISEGRLSRYLLYAIGEIVLVIVGILLAININNRVIDKNIKKENTVFLNKLLNELELNDERLKFLAFDKPNSFQKTVMKCDSLSKILIRGVTKEDQKHFTLASMVEGGSLFNLHSETYDELLNTGRLYNLGSDSLVSAIKSYYKIYEIELEYNRRWVNIIMQGVDLTFPTVGMANLQSRYDPQNQYLNKQSWYKDRNSQVYLRTMEGVNKMLYGQFYILEKCKRLIVETEHLKEIIERELENANS